jgi:hypothetical protein
MTRVRLRLNRQQRLRLIATLIAGLAVGGAAGAGVAAGFYPPQVAVAVAIAFGLLMGVSVRRVLSAARRDARRAAAGPGESEPG